MDIWRIKNLKKYIKWWYSSISKSIYNIEFLFNSLEKKKKKFTKTISTEKFFFLFFLLN